jgi:hypothetical protein
MMYAPAHDEDIKRCQGRGVCHVCSRHGHDSLVPLARCLRAALHDGENPELGGHRHGAR